MDHEITPGLSEYQKQVLEKSPERRWILPCSPREFFLSLFLMAAIFAALGAFAFIF